MNTSRPRILIARPDHLGDVILTLPAAAALRAAIPNAHISFLVNTRLGDVARRCPEIDETYTVTFPQLTAPPDPTGWTAIVNRNVSKLSGRFDLIIIARPEDPWSGELAAAASIPIRVGYATANTEPFLTLALPFYEQGHVVIQTLDLVKAAADCLGVTIGDYSDSFISGSFVPTTTEEAIADEVILEAPQAGANPIVFQPGSGWPLKNWVPERWGHLARMVRERWGIIPLVPGGPGEGSLVDSVVQASEGCAYGLAERLSVGALAALYKRASLVIALDSGPLHLAIMVGAPVVGVYTALDPVKWGPWSPPHKYRVISVPLSCSPCDCIYDPPCGVPIEPACSTGITTEMIISAAENFMNR